jgi:chemotaxis signal transduction protein
MNPADGGSGKAQNPATPETVELLKKRAERLRRPRVSAEEEAVLWVAEFPLGEETYALPLASLRAAVPLKMVTPVPLSLPHVIGVLRFQGQVVTALSLSSLVGARGWREDPAVLLLVDPGWGRLSAVDCEQIPKPSPLPLGLAEDAKSRNPGAVIPITTRDRRQVNLIDLARLLDRRAIEVASAR